MTNGFGPECFAIQGPARAFPYRLKVHYFSMGPMGYGMGTVQVVHHDGNGLLHYESRPFAVTETAQTVDLGLVKPI